MPWSITGTSELVVRRAFGLRRAVIVDYALYEDAWQRRKWRTVMCELYTAAVDAYEAGAAQAASRA